MLMKERSCWFCGNNLDLKKCVFSNVDMKEEKIKDIWENENCVLLCCVCKRIVDLNIFSMQELYLLHQLKELQEYLCYSFANKIFSEIVKLLNKVIELSKHELSFFDVESFAKEQDLEYHLYCSTDHGLSVKIFQVNLQKKYELLDIDNIKSFINRTKLSQDVITRFPTFFKNFLKYLMWKNLSKKQQL